MDRCTKILLALIASGLWVNALSSFAPGARAQGWPDPGTAEHYLQQIHVGLAFIANGQCANKKIC